jgi:CubicO group peptidase (beta-lactamase class C family)
MHLDGLDEHGVVPQIQPSEPGVVIHVVGRQPDERLLRVAGTANITTGAALRDDSIFYVGSVAKQFVAACVAMLSRDGILQLDASIRDYVPGLPDWWARVHLRHLIHHTGGLAQSYSPAGGIGPEGVPAWANEDLLAQIRGIPEPLDVPGVAHVYAGEGYLLLAEAAAQAAGRTFPELAMERLFEPLGMRDSFFRDEPGALPERAARGHFRATDGKLHVEPARFHAVGSGGMWTTAHDLALWSANLLDDRLAGGWLASTLTTRGTLADGRPIHYAWGLSVRTHRGARIVSHGGAFPGWEAKFVLFPDQGVTIVCLANTEELDVSSLGFLVADHVLQDDLDAGQPHADATFELDR